MLSGSPSSWEAHQSAAPQRRQHDFGITPSSQSYTGRPRCTAKIRFANGHGRSAEQPARDSNDTHGARDHQQHHAPVRSCSWRAIMLVTFSANVLICDTGAHAARARASMLACLHSTRTPAPTEGSPRRKRGARSTAMRKKLTRARCACVRGPGRRGAAPSLHVRANACKGFVSPDPAYPHVVPTAHLDEVIREREQRVQRADAKLRHVEPV